MGDDHRVTIVDDQGDRYDCEGLANCTTDERDGRLVSRYDYTFRVTAPSAALSTLSLGDTPMVYLTAGDFQYRLYQSSGESVTASGECEVTGLHYVRNVVELDRVHCTPNGPWSQALELCDAVSV